MAGGICSIVSIMAQFGGWPWDKDFF